MSGGILRNGIWAFSLVGILATGCDDRTAPIPTPSVDYSLALPGIWRGTCDPGFSGAHQRLDYEFTGEGGVAITQAIFDKGQCAGAPLFSYHYAGAFRTHVGPTQPGAGPGQLISGEIREVSLTLLHADCLAVAMRVPPLYGEKNWSLTKPVSLVDKVPAPFLSIAGTAFFPSEQTFLIDKGRLYFRHPFHTSSGVLSRLDRKEAERLP